MKTPLHSPFICGLFIFGLGFCCASAQAQEQKDPYKKTAANAASATPSASGSQAPASSAPKEPDANDNYCVTTTIEWIDIGNSDVMSLMRGSLAPNSAELIQKIRELETQGKATLVDTQSVTTKSGQRATSEGTKEFIYPTEYDPVDSNSANKAPAKAGDEKKAIQEDSTSTPTPTAFEMRPVGGRFELDPVAGPDGKTLDINMQAEYNLFTGWEGYGKMRVGGEIVPMVQQPIFASSKITTAVTIMSGQTIVAGIVTVQKEDGTIDPTKKRLLLVHGMIFPIRPQ